MQIPYATAVSMLKNGGLGDKTAHDAAMLFDEIEFPNSQEALETVKQFIELYGVHPYNAMALLNGAHTINQKEL